MFMKTPESCNQYQTICFCSVKICRVWVFFFFFSNMVGLMVKIQEQRGQSLNLHACWKVEVKVLKKMFRLGWGGKPTSWHPKSGSKFQPKCKSAKRGAEQRDHLLAFIQMCVARRCCWLGQRPEQRLEPDRLQPSHVTAHTEEAAGRVQPHGPLQDGHSENTRHGVGHRLYSCQTWWVRVGNRLQKHKNKTNKQTNKKLQQGVLQEAQTEVGCKQRAKWEV